MRILLYYVWQRATAKTKYLLCFFQTFKFYLCCDFLGVFYYNLKLQFRVGFSFFFWLHIYFFYLLIIFFVSMNCESFLSACGNKKKVYFFIFGLKPSIQAECIYHFRSPSQSLKCGILVRSNSREILGCDMVLGRAGQIKGLVFAEWVIKYKTINIDLRNQISAFRLLLPMRRTNQKQIIFEKIIKV